MICAFKWYLGDSNPIEKGDIGIKLCMGHLNVLLLSILCCSIVVC